MLLDTPQLIASEDNLNRFYTRYAIGELLASQLDDISPQRIIDLGAGEGMLSSSAAKIWNNTEVVTVDIDPSSAENLHKNIIQSGASKHSHYIENVFNPNLPDLLPLENGLFDLAVCNPPFFKPEWSNNFSTILQKADFGTACPSKADVTGEALFLAQNLRLVKDGGKIALITPDSMMTGWKTVQLRKAILEKHRIDSVLQLPRHSFHDTEARCFIVVITKGMKQDKPIKLLKFDNDSGMSEPVYVSSKEAEKRLDYEFHVRYSVTQEGREFTTLRELGADIKRGSVSTVEAKQTEFPVFHTTDYGKVLDGKLYFHSSMPDSAQVVIAQPGDILMARVDRSLHQKIAIVTSGSAAVTDCVYRVRIPKEFQETVFTALNSPEGRDNIKAATKGVSARLLGKADLLDLPLFI